jgi:hypothetical protein
MDRAWPNDNKQPAILLLQDLLDGVASVDDSRIGGLARRENALKRSRRREPNDLSNV